jgi:hypothetical protein
MAFLLLEFMLFFDLSAFHNVHLGKDLGVLALGIELLQLRSQVGALW